STSPSVPLPPVSRWRSTRARYASAAASSSTASTGRDTDMWFSPPSRDQAIALAGVFQACQLVASLATTGSCLPPHFETCIHSLFEQNPPSTLAVFGDIDALWTGLDTLNRVLGATRAQENAALLRYVLGVFYLQRKLAGNPAMLKKVGEGIDRARRQAEH